MNEFNNQKIHFIQREKIEMNRKRVFKKLDFGFNFAPTLEDTYANFVQ